MSTLSKREIGMLVGGVVVVFGIGIYAILNPPPSAAGKAQLTPAQASQQAKDKLAKITSMTRDQARLEPRIAQMSYDLPPDLLVPRLINDLQRIARKSDVHLREIKPQKPRDLGGVTGARVTLEIRFRAPLQPAVIKFLYFVEDPSGKMTVDKVILNTVDSKSNTVDVTALISVFTRSAPDPAGALQVGRNDAIAVANQT